MNENDNNEKYELIKFVDGNFSLDVNVSPKDDTVWLTQSDMAMLFEVDRTRITRHINSIFGDFELAVEGNVRKTHFPLSDKMVNLYNLDVILAVGFRVKSKRGILFRRWVNNVLKNYLIYGYSINDKRCLECKDNIISLNNKVNYLLNENKLTKDELKSITSKNEIFKDKIFYENDIYDGYSFIRKLINDAKKRIILIDNYIDISVLDYFNDIFFIPITIYTCDSSHIKNKDIEYFKVKHQISLFKTNVFHDRFLAIDDNLYSIGSSIKDIGKKRTLIVKLNTITIEDITKNI